MGSDAARRHEFGHVGTVARWTFGRRIIGFENQFFKTLATAIALIFIDRHNQLLIEIGNIIMVLPFKSRERPKSGFELK